MSTKPTIRANAETEDQHYSINFNAAPWFEQASIPALIDLIRCDYKDDDAADRVAIETNRPDLKKLFNYIEASEKHAKPGMGVGLNCTINAEDAITWIAQNRPKIHHHTSLEPLSRDTILEAWGNNSNWDEQTRLKHTLGFLDHSEDHTPEAFEEYLSEASFEEYKDRARLILSEQGLTLPKAVDEEEFLRRAWFTEISPTDLPERIRQLSAEETPEAAFIRECLEGLAKLFVPIPTDHEPIRDAFTAGRSVNDVIVEYATQAAENHGYVIPLPHNDAEPLTDARETAHVELAGGGLRISIPGLEHPDQEYPASVLIEHYEGHVLAHLHYRTAQDETCDETTSTVILKGPQTAAEYEKLWADFQDTPTDTETPQASTTQDFFIWPAGTPTADVIAWFQHAATTRIRPGESIQN